MAGRNSRPMVVFKQGSMTTTRPLSNRIAQWIIAVSLVVIATCLVWMAVQQNQRRQLVLDDASPDVPPATSTARTRDTPSWPKPPTTAAAKRDNSRKPPGPAFVPVVSEPSRTIEPPVLPAVAIEQPQGGALLPVATAATAAMTNGATIIAGRVTLSGKPPPEDKFTIHDSICGKSGNGQRTTRNYVVSTNGGLANVFVRIRNGLEKIPFPAPAAAMLDQVNCQFEPYVTGLMVNQVLRIHNSDKGLHNVQAAPAPQDNRPFSINESQGKTAEVQFAQAEVPIRLTCAIHPWMRAFVCVADNPFFAVTDADGGFSISNVPPGKYVLEAYHVRTHEKQSGVLQQVEVTPGATVTANFTIEVPSRLASRH